MQAVVTGAAGFIGSHLVDHLLSAGHSVVGVDAFRSYYPEVEKHRNLAVAYAHPAFRLIAADLLAIDLDELLASADVVFHLAAQPGVRHSWSDFRQYDADNVLATHAILEAARRRRLERFVYASSSSVYGNAASYPSREIDVPAPHSPYGVTKLAGEHLCGLYATNWSIPTVCLRYFTVYGPRQRPDMAMRRMIGAAFRGSPFPLYGAGDQIRDFTFVADIVAATAAAASADVAAGRVFNVAGTAAATVLDVLRTVEAETGRQVVVQRRPPSPGDVARTGASTERARLELGWEPVVGIDEGIRQQVRWHAETFETEVIDEEQPAPPRSPG